MGSASAKSGVRNGNVGLLAPVRAYIASLVHPSAQNDALTAARHRAFIAPRIIGGAVALAFFPAYLVARGAPSLLELVVFSWFVAPIVIAYFLSRTGRYESAHALSSLALTGLVAVVAGSTGGIESFAAILFVVVPLEAALSASRRVVAVASAFALAAAGLLLLAGRFELVTHSDGHAVLTAFGVALAVLYAAGLALGAEAMARTNVSLLYAEEDRYRLLAENMTDVITRHDCDGAVLLVSPVAQSLFGCGVGELRGQGLFHRVHIADRPAYLTALGEASALGKSQSVEFRVRRDSTDATGGPTAQFGWIEMRCRPLDFAAGEVNGHRRHEVVAVLRDITDRKCREDVVEDARTQAERANNAKSRFLATMSHELRTPLNAIIGFSDMLRQEQALALDLERRSEYAGLINQSGHHLLAVINGILDMSKIETGKFEIMPEPFAPAKVVAGCCHLLKLQAEKAGIAIAQSLNGELPELVADKRALQQILLNLLSNAIRFTDRGGKVTVGARAEAGAITFVVEDNGIGIGDEDLARVGEPYFQARASYDRSHGGTGLGLSIVKGLVQLHGGGMNISSRFGEGTRVCVRLPLDCGRAAPASTARQVVGPLPFNSLAERSNSTKGRDVAAMLAVRTRVKKSA